MGVIRVLKNDLSKVFRNTRMLFAVLATTYIYLLSEAYTEPGGKRLNVLQLMLEFDKEQKLSNPDICRQVLYQLGGLHMNMFVPIIIGYLLIEVLSVERQTGFRRLQVFRVSRIEFLLGRFLHAGVSGGILLVLGNLIYRLLVYLCFYDMSEYGEVFSITTYGSELFSAFSSLTGWFFFGFYIGSIICFCSSFIRNQYLLMATPFLINYLSEVFLYIQKLLSLEGVGKMGQWAFFLSPVGLLSWYMEGQLAYNIFYMFVIIALATIYCEIEKRCLDFGR